MISPDLLGQLQADEAKERSESYYLKTYNRIYYKWVKILIQLKQYINLLRGSFNYKGWVERIKFIINNIKNYNENFNLDICEINRIIDNYLISSISDQTIVLNVIREI